MNISLMVVDNELICFRIVPVMFTMNETRSIVSIDSLMIFLKSVYLRYLEIISKAKNRFTSPNVRIIH